MADGHRARALGPRLTVCLHGHSGGRGYLYIIIENDMVIRGNGTGKRERVRGMGKSTGSGDKVPRNGKGSGEETGEWKGEAYSNVTSLSDAVTMSNSCIVRKVRPAQWVV